MKQKVCGIVVGLWLLTSAAAAQQLAEPRPQPEQVAGEAQPFHAQGFGGWTARFFENEEAMKLGIPSAVLHREPRFPQALPADFPVRPKYEREGKVTRVELPLPEGASVYGLGGVGGALLRNGFCGEIPGLHGVLVVLLADGSGYAVLADTTQPLRVTIEGSLRLESEAATLPLVITAAEDPLPLISNLGSLMGQLEMPPRWGLGFGLEAGTIAAAEQVIAGSGGPGLVSVWVRQAEASDDLDRLTAAASEKNLRVGTVIDPLAPPPVHQRETAATGVLAQAAGDLAFPDLTSKPGVQWWSDGIAKLRERGISGALIVWPDALLRQQATFSGADWWGPGDMDRYGWLLPRLMQRATRSGIAPDEQGIRPMVHSTQWVAGSQAFGGTLVPAGPDAVRQAIQLSISGCPLVGVRGRTVEELATAIVALPLAVGIASEDGTLEGDQELLGKLVAARTQLIPSMYTLLFNGFFHAQPMVRPVFMAEPQNASLREIDWAYLLGTDVMVVPRREDGSRPEPPLPGWRKLDFGLADTPAPDLYLRPGAILPIADPQQVWNEPISPLTLLVNFDEQGQARALLFEDGGDGYEFYRNGCRRIGHSAQRQGEFIYVRLSQLDGGWAIPERRLLVRVLTDDGVIEGEGSERGTLRIPAPKPGGP